MYSDLNIKRLVISGCLILIMFGMHWTVQAADDEKKVVFAVA